MSQQPPPCHAVKTVFRHLQCFLRQLVFFLVSMSVTMVSPWCHHCTDATPVSSPWHKRSVSSGYHCHELVKLYIHSTDINLYLYMQQVPCLGYLTFPDPPEWLIKNHFMLHIFKSCAQIVLTETAAIVLTKYAFWWFSVFWTLGFVRLPLPRGGETSHQWKIWLIWW